MLEMTGGGGGGEPQTLVSSPVRTASILSFDWLSSPQPASHWSGPPLHPLILCSRQHILWLKYFTP